MKTFMTFVWILIFGAAISGCVTMSTDESPNKIHGKEHTGD